MIFGSCHLILFISLTNYFQIVRRQCCLPIISKGGQVDSMHKSSPLARCSISWRQILCCYLGGSPPHPTSILGRPGAYVSCQSLVQVALDQCTCTSDTSLFVSTLPGLPISITLYNLAVWHWIMPKQKTFHKKYKQDAIISILSNSSTIYD